MIDIEREVFDLAAKAVRQAFPDVYMTGEYVPAPPRFPCVTLMEVDNESTQYSRDSSGMEFTTVISFEVNVYSNKVNGKKTECREIMKIIDTKLDEFGLTRRTMTPVPNFMDMSIYRITARYYATVDKNYHIYRR